MKLRTPSIKAAFTLVFTGVLIWLLIRSASVLDVFTIRVGGIEVGTFTFQGGITFRWTSPPSPGISYERSSTLYYTEIREGFVVIPKDHNWDHLGGWFAHEQSILVTFYTKSGRTSDWVTVPFGDPRSVGNPTRRDTRLFSVPYFPLFCLPLLLFARRLWIRARGLRRIQRGLCAQCGYDLRASNERCPECGLPVPANSF